MNDKNKLLAERRLARTKARREYLESLGFQVVWINECDFYERLRNGDQLLQTVVNEKLPSFSAKHRFCIKDENIILKAVEEGELFGMIKCDIEVPDALWNKFKDFSPIFQTVDVPIESLNQKMQDYVKEMNLSTKPRRVLVGGMKARQILLSTDLLKWYMAHGLVASNIDLVIEFPKGQPFRKFQEMVTNARRQGDCCGDKTAQVRADQAKLLGVRKVT